MNNSTECFSADEYRLAAKVVRARYDYGEHIAKEFELRAAELDHAQNTLLDSLHGGDQT